MVVVQEILWQIIQYSRDVCTVELEAPRRGVL